jgi:hypothetical protein
VAHAREIAKLYLVPEVLATPPYLAVIVENDK